MGKDSVNQAEVTDAVSEALEDLNPEIAYDNSEAKYLRMQIVSKNFQGMDLVTRIQTILKLLDLNCPRLFETHRIRIEAYTPREWERLPDSSKGNSDPTITSTRMAS